MSERKASVLTSLQAIAKKASERPEYRFRDLFRLLNEDMLRDSWRYVRKNAAYGVDKVSAVEYGQNLEANIHQLVEELKRKRYRAKNVLRRYIPKGKDKLRPLGIPATQDKLLQMAVKRILEAIFEQDFLNCSYGYRPGVGILDAVDDLTVKLQFGKYNYVVEADISGYFDNIDHDDRVERNIAGDLRKVLGVFDVAPNNVDVRAGSDASCQVDVRVTDVDRQYAPRIPR